MVDILQSNRCVTTLVEIHKAATGAAAEAKVSARQKS